MSLEKGEKKEKEKTKDNFNEGEGKRREGKRSEEEEFLSRLFGRFGGNAVDIELLPKCPFFLVMLKFSFHFIPLSGG